MGIHIDPLASPELQRALAFARARESYPAIPSELLLDLCNAAWERAAGEGEDGLALGRFERAMDLVARGYRAGGGRLSVSEVAQQAIPVAALRPYIKPAGVRPLPFEPAVEEPVPVRHPLAARLARIPMLSPAPVGATLAAGLLGLAIAGKTGSLPVISPAPAGSGDEGANVRPEHGGSAPGETASADPMAETPSSPAGGLFGSLTGEPAGREGDAASSSAADSPALAHYSPAADRPTSAPVDVDSVPVLPASAPAPAGASEGHEGGATAPGAAPVSFAAPAAALGLSGGRRHDAVSEHGDGDRQDHKGRGDRGGQDDDSPGPADILRSLTHPSQGDGQPGRQDGSDDGKDETGQEPRQGQDPQADDGDGESGPLSSPSDGGEAPPRAGNGDEEVDPAPSGPIGADTPDDVDPPTVHAAQEGLSDTAPASAASASTAPPAAGSRARPCAAGPSRCTGLRSDSARTCSGAARSGASGSSLV